MKRPIGSLLFAAGCLFALSIGAEAFAAEEALVPTVLELPDAVPAFPGAWGFGMFTPGGRGGKVIEVTNLNDSGPGSFRAAVEAEGPRIVVFRVAGIIRLESPVTIKHPFLTLAGHTAPGDGVCVAGQTTEINTHDVIIRHMRFRRGNLTDRNDALGGYPVDNIMIDHCSTSWGLDENMSIYRWMRKVGDREVKTPTTNVTIQWTISSEALNPNNHAFGGTWGGRNNSFHHNLFACNTGRNPSIGIGRLLDYRNNVVFNWRHRTMDGGGGMATVNVINNYYKAGPITNPGPLQCRIFKLEGIRDPDRVPAEGLLYLAGNYVAGHADVTQDNWNGGVQLDEDAPTPFDVRRVRRLQPHAAFPMPQQTAVEAYESVLAHGGATLPKRDAVDQRIIEIVRSGKPTFQNGIINSPNDVGGYPEYKSGPAPADADHDAITDDWERKHGLNPADAADGPADADKDGYTNVEEFLNNTDPNQLVDYRKLENNRSSLE